MKRFKQVYAIAVVTFQEIVRDKILYNTLFFAVFLIALGFLAANLTFIQPLRVLINSGVNGISLALSVLAILIGSHLLNREFERRTIFVALSRPITRGQFLFGKFLGLAGVLLVNWALLILALWLAVGAMFGWGGDSPTSDYFSMSFWIGLTLVYLQSLMVAAISMMLSTISTTSIAAVTAFGVYFVGSNLSTLLGLSKTVKGEFEKAILMIVTRALPNFEFFNLGFVVTYDLPVDRALIVKALVYWAAWVGGALLLGSWLIEKKESN